MLDVAILGQVALGYSPFIDRNRTVAATRLSVYPLRPDANLDVAQLLHAVGDVWPASGGNVSLNVVSESLVHDLLHRTEARRVDERGNARLQNGACDWTPRRRESATGGQRAALDVSTCPWVEEHAGPHVGG